MHNSTLRNSISIGFCQPKFYKRSVWLRAKNLMELLCKSDYVVPFDYGRGKGKYNTTDILEKLKIESHSDQIDFLVIAVIDIALEQAIKEHDNDKYDPYICACAIKILKLKQDSDEANTVLNRYQTIYG